MNEEKGTILAGGGTGARALEALIFLSIALKAAKSYKNNNIRLYAILIDADEANAMVQTTKELFKNYRQAFKKDKDYNMLPIKIESAIRDKEEDIFYHIRNAKETASKLLGEILPDQKLMKFLYDSDALNVDLKIGYVGRSALGILGILDAFDDLFGRKEKDNNDKGAEGKIRKEAIEGKPIFTIGTLFGGTGASLLSALPHKLNEIAEKESERVAVMCFPYFDFEFEDKNQSESKRKEVNPDAFYVKAIRGLGAYVREKGLDGYDYIVVTGMPKDYKAKIGYYDKGGAGQKNAFHFIDVVNALGIVDYFHEKLKKDKINFGYGWDEHADMGREIHHALNSMELASLVTLLFFGKDNSEEKGSSSITLIRNALHKALKEKQDIDYYNDNLIKLAEEYHRFFSQVVYFSRKITGSVSDYDNEKEDKVRIQKFKKKIVKDLKKRGELEKILHEAYEKTKRTEPEKRLVPFFVNVLEYLSEAKEQTRKTVADLVDGFENV